jgi:hypothetical protein
METMKIGVNMVMRNVKKFLIQAYFNSNANGIMVHRSNDGEFVENRQPRERPLIARAAKSPRFN